MFDNQIDIKSKHTVVQPLSVYIHKVLIIRCLIKIFELFIQSFCLHFQILCYATLTYNYLIINALAKIM